MGVLGLFRQLLPPCRHLPLEEGEGQGGGSLYSSLLGLYQLCAARYLRHVDHNIVNAGLETLQSLLRHAPPLLAYALCSPGGVAQASWLGVDEEEAGQDVANLRKPLPTGKISKHRWILTGSNTINTLKAKQNNLKFALAFADISPFDKESTAIHDVPSLIGFCPHIDF